MPNSRGIGCLTDLFRVGLSFTIGLGGCYVAAKWGIRPLITLVAAPIAVQAFYDLMRRKASSQSNDALDSVQPSSVRSFADRIRVPILMLCGACLGMILGFALTFEVYAIQPRAVSDRVIQYPSGGPLEYNTYLTSVSECEEILSFWGYRTAQVFGSSATDVLGWSGPLSDLDYMWDEASFGSRALNGQLLSRRALGSFCVDGSSIVWGIDETRQSDQQQVRWRWNGQHWTAQPFLSGYELLAILQYPTRDSLIVLARDLSSPEKIVCASVPARLPLNLDEQLDSNGARVGRLDPGEEAIDADIRGRTVGLLIGQRDYESRFVTDLRVVRSVDCNPDPAASTRLTIEGDSQSSDGEEPAAVQGPSLVLGPNEALAIGEGAGAGLRMFLFQNGRYQRSITVDLGYDPTNRGISEMRSRPASEFWVLAWGYSETSGNTTGQSGFRTENHVIRYRWVGTGTVCLRLNPDICVS